jgi:hypothetical protein
MGGIVLSTNGVWRVLRYLRYDNTERAHTGRWTRGRTPEAVLGKAKLWHRRR